jgi:signal transduction histidine kinase
MSSNPVEPDLPARLARLEARLREEERKVAIVQEIGAALGSTLDLDRLLALIMEKVTELLSADRSTLYLTTDDGQELWSKIAQGGEIREIRLRVGEGIAGWVGETGEVVNIPDAYSDPRFQQDFDRRSGYRTRSILCMPMRNNLGRIVGVIQVLNKKDGPFTKEDENLLHTVGGQAAISIENSKLYLSVVGKNVQLLETQEKLEQKMYELDLLFEIEEEMHEALDLDEMLDKLLARAMDLVGAEAGSILLREHRTDELYFRSARGERGEAVKRMRIPMAEGIVGWVATQRQPLIVNDPGSDPRWSSKFAQRVGFAPRNLLAVPLVADGNTLGAFELLNKLGARRFDAADLKLLTLIAGQASKAIQMTRSKEEKLNESRLASIGQMLSGVLHDLKTPMTIVSGYAQLMAQIDDGDQRAQYVDQILKQFDLMSAMTREVLQFARGESNLLIRKVYLHKFLDEITAHLRQEFAGKNVQLVIQPLYRGLAFFDEAKLLRVVHNIARNAAEAMGLQGGTFTLTVSTLGGKLIFSFADTGPGISPEIEGRLFDLFATSGKKEGTGLGLAIVKKIVEDHQGEIAYHTQPGHGTTFVLTLPLERPLGMGDSSGPIRLK